MIRQCHTDPGVCAELCAFPPACIPASPKTMSVLQPLYSLLSQQLSHSPDQDILLLLNMKTYYSVQSANTARSVHYDEF